ncbi:MAG: choice-of-anchor tandem repeat GloVer-containing protein [Candidatus Cybelea sp.]
MKRLLNHVAAFLSVALLAGCGGGTGFSSSTPTSVAPQIAAPLSQSPTRVTAERTHLRPAYSALYSFKGSPDDGADPIAGLINVSGTLYGTTSRGGSNECSNQRGCGTVFAITTSGTETVLHSFIGKKGYAAWAALLDVSGSLYGTTANGGANRYYGTVFKITTSGAETVLHSFDGTDGGTPYADLLDVKGKLYGTTFSEGANDAGTVFAITKSGKETVLHSFCSIASCKDGAYPIAGLIDVKGTLYGTTNIGGANGDGTVFAITPSGNETVLYSFKASGDGAKPSAALLNVKGTLYGTTAGGGVACGSYGCGTVFKITTSGKETVLHSFSGSGDGATPSAALLNVKGTLYGTTEYGGANCTLSGVCGTVFKVTTSGKETVLHSFGGSGDGTGPEGALLNVSGTLYGTTEYGGANGDGTVFSLSP